MTSNLKLFFKEFSDLSTDDLYAILNLRQQVFVVEQNCPYLDADYFDQDAFHLLGYENDDLVAYLRAFSPNIKYKESSMGRIVVSKKNRNKDYGKLITRYGIDFLKGKYPKNEIIISAQHRLLSFYNQLGFKTRGEIYLEDNIDHIQMFIEPNL